MVLIHAADLHLGKTLHERELLEEQEAMLEALLQILAERKPAALLLAGDIYDRAIPPPSAIGLLDTFLSKAVEMAPDTAIVMIPGNHDSATRLAFGSGLFRRAGVHMISRASASPEPVIVSSRIDPGAGRGATTAGPASTVERCAIWALPFLSGAASADGSAPSAGGTPSTGSAPELARGQAALFAAAVETIRQQLDVARAASTAGATAPVSYNVLLAHCFASGGTPSESERAFVGLAEEVDARLFDAFDYAALGHLHRPQAAGAKGHYSGSPLAYSFGEALRLRSPATEALSLRSPSTETPSVADKVERGFLLVELGCGGVRTELLPFRPARRLVRIEAPFESLCDPTAFGAYRGDLVEACLTDALPVLEPSERLKEAFPNLLSVRQAAFEPRTPASGEGYGPMPMDSGGDPRDPRRLLEEFAAFHREMMDGEPDEALVSLFRSIVEEAAHEAD